MSIRSVQRHRASVIPTARAPLRASLDRLLDRVAQAWVAWRRDRHDARYLRYLDAASLDDMRVDRSLLGQLGAEPRGSRGARQGFPF